MDLYTHIFDFDNESAQRIAKITIDYPLSLYRCAELLEMLGPLAKELGPQGLIDWLKFEVRNEME